MIHVADSVLREALSTSFGDYQIVEAFRPIRTVSGLSPHVFKGMILTKGLRLCLMMKLKHPAREGSTQPTNLKFEAASLSHCERIGISTPKVIGVGLNYAWLLMTHVPGTPIGRSELGNASSAVFESVGRALALIHTTECGPRESIRAILNSETSSERLSILNDNLQSLRHDKITTKLAKVLVRLRKAIPRREKLVFTHRDFSGENILITSQMKLYITDWETARFSPPEADLAFVCGRTSGVCRNDDDAAILLASYQYHAKLSIKSFAFYRALSLAEQAINAISNNEDSSASLVCTASGHSLSL